MCLKPTVRIKRPKQKKCRICKQPYTQFNSLNPTCGKFDCQLAFAVNHANKSDALRRKQERIETRARKVKIKTLTQWEKEAEAVVNKYCRLRDYHRGCVSCDKPANWYGQWHASHFRSVAAASSIRYNLWNIHKSCSVCNNWLSSNHAEYEPRLRAKIGDAKVDWLNAQNQTVKYEVDYLARLKKIFSKRCRIMEKRLGLT